MEVGRWWRRNGERELTVTLKEVVIKVQDYSRLHNIIAMFHATPQSHREH